LLPAVVWPVMLHSLAGTRPVLTTLSGAAPKVSECRSVGVSECRTDARLDRTDDAPLPSGQLAYARQIVVVTALPLTSTTLARRVT
jgi:hypothetical protein